MGESINGHRGGIASLRRLIDQFPGAIQADLLDRGYKIRDIGTDKLAWDEAGHLIENLPPLPTSALYRARHPNTWWWTNEFNFYARLIRAVEVSNWQRAGGPGSPPEAITPPTEHVAAQPDEDVYDIEDIGAELARRRALLSQN